MLSCDALATLFSRSQVRSSGLSHPELASLLVQLTFRLLSALLLHSLCWQRQVCTGEKAVTWDAMNGSGPTVQVFGGYGYLKEYKVERVWRDLRVHRLLEGTNEIMNVIIARELMKQ